jgi:hypothetical protein
MTIFANVHDCNFKRPFVTTIDSKASSLNFTQLIFNGAPSYANTHSRRQNMDEVCSTKMQQ